jgi:acetyltransferase-like isoleucine patch superfamily enzyme
MIRRRVIKLFYIVQSAVKACWLNCRPGVSVGANCRIHRTVLLDLSEGGSVILGRNVQLCAGVILAPQGGRIEIEDGTFIGPYCVLYGHGGLTVGKCSMIAAHSVVIPANHVFSRIDVPIRMQAETRLGIEIGDDVWIGCGVRILDGLRIGNGSVIGAGAVVTRDVPEGSVAVGVPARIVRKRDGQAACGPESE